MNEIQDQKIPLLVQAVKGKKTERVPVWLMRQAGRYLPEYRALRADAGGFLKMVYNPEIASEITLQPIRRFGMDGAILFSDILVIAQALGRDLWFEEGEGPRLDPLAGGQSLPVLDSGKMDKTLGPIYETLHKTRKKLDGEGFDETALIGFAGGMWTLACYMIEGRGSKDFSLAKNYAAQDPEKFSALIETIRAATLHYLIRQAQSGAQVVQLFESWAGILDETGFARWVIEPTKKLVADFNAACPGVPVIGFARGVPLSFIETYVEETGINGVGCDFTHAPKALKPLQDKVCVQGNLDPALLLEGGPAMEGAARNILDTLSGGPFIFNLGHGVIKETPPEHVAQLVKLVQEYRS